MAIEFDHLSESAEAAYPRLFETFKESLSLTDEQAAIAVSIATGVCPHCWSEPRSTCNCWNDD